MRSLLISRSQGWQQAVRQKKQNLNEINEHTLEYISCNHYEIRRVKMARIGITLEELKERLKTEYYNAYKKAHQDETKKLISKKMFYGSLGIGKTQAVYQVAKELANMLGKNSST